LYHCATSYRPNLCLLKPNNSDTHEKTQGIHRTSLRDAQKRHNTQNGTMTQHTSRLCKGYLTKKESGGVLHQMTWPLQSPDLNPIVMVWDAL
uniref:Uncharacterized protein n=1 Tax=Oncorhynchus tshawytscha TaxID=74940 RepID=A0AAZ3NPM9_ONCTS